MLAIVYSPGWLFDLFVYGTDGRVDAVYGWDGGHGVDSGV